MAGQYTHNTEEVREGRAERVGGQHKMLRLKELGGKRGGQESWAWTQRVGFNAKGDMPGGDQGEVGKPSQS